MGQENRVDLNSSEEVSRLDEILSSGHFATSVKDGIWMIIMIHQDIIIVEELAI